MSNTYFWPYPESNLKSEQAVCKILSYIAQSVACQTQEPGPKFDDRTGHILSFLLPLVQEAWLSVTGESMW